MTSHTHVEVLRLRNGPAEDYSQELINAEDLAVLAQVARGDVERFFSRRPDMARLYQNRFLCSALCQGGAIHFAFPDYGYGVKDFDVWIFFSQTPPGHPRGMFKRRPTPVAFPSPKFGEDPGHIVVGGRRIDLLWRTVNGTPKEPVRAVQAWLGGGSKSARQLGAKCVVLVDPGELRGRIIWSLGAPIDATVGNPGSGD